MGRVMHGCMGKVVHGQGHAWADQHAWAAGSCYSLQQTAPLLLQRGQSASPSSPLLMAGGSRVIADTQGPYGSEGSTPAQPLHPPLTVVDGGWQQGDCRHPGAIGTCGIDHLQPNSNSM